MKHIFIIGCRGYHYNYGGWETFVSSLVDNYNDKNTVFHIGQLGENNEEIKINDNIIVNNIKVGIGSSAKMLVYTIKTFNYYINYVKDNKLKNCYFLILGLKLGPYLKLKKKELKKLKIKTFVNPDGLEHMRSKWNYFIKKFFLYSEKVMLNNCDKIVCDALGIKEYIDKKYKKLKNKTVYIAYGTEEVNTSDDEDIKVLEEYELEKDKYLLMVGRCVPENNYELVITEFMKSSIGKKLVIISNISNGNYYNKLISDTDCLKDTRIKFIDGVYDKKKLTSIRKNAFLYIHGHSVGGTNPSLLEALSTTDLNVLYDVNFNKDVGMDSCLYFKEEGSLEKILEDSRLLENSKKKLGKKAKKIIKENFTWEIIVNKYKEIFK